MSLQSPPRAPAESEGSTTSAGLPRPTGTWIAVAGTIGVGKSTLAALIARRTGADYVPERFADNPFLARFYAPGGIERWGFHTEASFLAQRFDQTREITAALEAGRSVVTDFVPQQNLLFARITLNAEEFALYEQLFSRLFSLVRKADRLVCLDAELRVISRRIRTRGRAMEAGIPGAYLKKLRAGYHQWRESPPAPTVWIDTSKMPIPTDLVARAEALDAVMKSLDPATQRALFGSLSPY